LEDDKIVALVRNGQTEAFTEIMERYQSAIIHYLHRLTGDNDLAADLAQDTFIQAYQGLMKSNAEINLRPWLYRIASNNAWQYWRRRRLLSLVPFSRFKQPPEPLVYSVGNPDDEKLVIKDVISKIPLEQRTCLILHYAEGLKYREIADILNISEEAVRKRVSRGKKVFLKHYNKGDVE
jgi:RNA polymerase sigma-70 factor (ECF subfamily)